MRIIKLTVLALCLGVSVVWADDRPIYKDKNAPIEDRVEDLLRRMTLREKVGQLQQRCTWDINNRLSKPPIYTRRYMNIWQTRPVWVFLS